MQKWGHKYNSGYGARFYEWLKKVKMLNHITAGAKDLLCVFLQQDGCTIHWKEQEK